jgi:type IV pilus assembly protein PilN
MIRINLLPVRRKKKAKPVPVFVITALLTTLVVIGVLGYLFFHFSSSLKETKIRFEANKQRIAELKNKIKEVDNFETLNNSYEDKNRIIEQLRKNQAIPVIMLDEISKDLPNGTWLHSMSVSNQNASLDGYAFTNSDVVAYVNNLKSSKAFREVFLQESKQAEVDKIPVYQFKLTFKVVS